MNSRNDHPNIAVIGAGISGAACAAGLRQAGLAVTVFDKSREVGGRMATRRARWTDEAGNERLTAFDHGAQNFSAQTPRFRAMVARAQTAGAVAAWRQSVYGEFPASRIRSRFVPTPNMPALCRHLMTDATLCLSHSVQRLQRSVAGWQLVLADGGSAGPFDHVMLAMPPAQAALLLAGLRDDWADELEATRMDPCWTLMAITNDVDWPWDAAEPERSPLALIARNDRKPGRNAVPGQASWVAHATPEWSALHADDDPAAVTEALCAALKLLLPCHQPLTWHHTGVQRWRYAAPAPMEATPGRADCWWDAQLCLGVCGDSFGNGTVEAAWHSGDELADTVAACIDINEAAAETAPQPVEQVLIAQETH